MKRNEALHARGIRKKCRIDPFVFFLRRPIMISAFGGRTKKMKNPPIKTAVFFLLLSLVVLTKLQAATTLLPAAPSKYVTDNASVLKANTADRLSGQLADFDHRTADELIIIIDPNLPRGVSIGEYARQLYDGWKIGKRGKDTGALLLICTQERQGWDIRWSRAGDEAH